MNGPNKGPVCVIRTSLVKLPLYYSSDNSLNLRIEVRTKSNGKKILPVTWSIGVPSLNTICLRWRTSRVGGYDLLYGSIRRTLCY